MPAKKSNNSSKSFPHKLHALLESATENSFSDIISWQAGGKSFKVHQPKVFVKLILPVHFKQSKFKSFLRQLNIYGFQRIQYGPNKGGYAHQHLVQGVPELCMMIKRVSTPEGKAAAAIAAQPAVPAIRKRSEMTPSNINIVPSDISGLAPHSKGSMMGSLGSLGSLGMNGPEAHFQQSDAQNETFNMQFDGLSSFLGSTNNSISLSIPGSGKQNETFHLKDDFSAFGKPSCWGNDLLGGGPSNSSANSLHSIRMNGSELNFFKDLFQPSDLEGDVPLFCPSSSQSTTGNNVAEPNKHNAVFDNPAATVGLGRSKSLGPEYVASNGFLEKKPGCLEPTIDELLGLITEGGEKNEDLNRSESVFPSKLHRMLQDAKREGFEHIVSWIHGGTAFKVHDIAAFMQKIMPIYFDQSKFESFRRQLNLYGFTRVTRGPSRGMYYHQDFVQNDPSLCQNITRPKSVRKRRKQSAVDVPSSIIGVA